MIAANPATQRLVADLFGNDLTQQSISRVPIEFERGRLQFGRAQFQLSYVAPAAFVFRKQQHRPGDPAAARGRVNIHAPQFHGVGCGGLQSEHADDFLVPDSDPEAAVPLAVVSRDPIHLLGQ